MSVKQRTAGRNWTQEESKDPEPCNGYVVYCFDRLQDGWEDWTVSFETWEKTQTYVEEVTNRYQGVSRVVVFELGKRVDFKLEKVEENKPVEVTTKFKVKRN